MRGEHGRVRLADVLAVGNEVPAALETRVLAVGDATVADVGVELDPHDSAGGDYRRQVGAGLKA
jgi:hypothetical protein